MHFKDRIDAAQKLAPKLAKYKGKPGTIILAIPRGALKMGYELVKLLQLPLDIVVTKKIPAPGNEEYAIGSIAPDGKTLLNSQVVKSYGIGEGYIEGVKKRLLDEIYRRYNKYRGEEEIPSFKGKTVILIDDGIATGFTMKAAIEYLRRTEVKKLIVAVPVSARDSAKEIEDMADEFICLDKPLMFFAVGQFYDIFPQVSDEEAADYLKMSREHLKGLL